ncbi:DUF6223 family protein [Saccharothrix variisporea]|uniref:Uncharacterized protein n=1 Tax=Saccharothrix variisporea TaxID=543527 RepID=A0A495X2P1_9PSEU|nr:DUF6223 family protein [Saccharothrix variisporea]RKT67756.1 hypothetical protein DFJ66_0932 [Saccharothrix variisporea]
MSHLATTAQFLAQSTDSYTLTPGRAWSLVGMGFGLIGLVVGIVSRVRKAGGSRTAFTSLGTGAIGLALGVYVVTAAKGGPGTGYGIVGGVFSVLIGVAALGLGWLTLSRSRRAAVRG